MKVKDLYEVIQGKICIYKKIEESEKPDFEDLYKGDKSNAPKELLEMEVFLIAGVADSVLDIQVKP